MIADNKPKVEEGGRVVVAPGPLLEITSGFEFPAG